MDAVQETIHLYQRASELRWQGDAEGARKFANDAIRTGNKALDTARDPALCREVSTLLMVCIQLHDGIGAARR